jgi:hypothetical protein
VRTKRRFPTFGLKKVRDFLRRFGGQSVSTGSVRKVLAAEGLHQPIQPARRRKREIIRRVERSKPGELWQTDITSYVLTRSRVRVYLTVFLDDFSRYVVSWSLATHQKSALVCEALMDGIERFGKPEEVLSDQGRQYFAWRGKSDFQRLLVREGIRHVVSRTHHPETLGKCERLWETIGTELWQRTQPQDLGEARAARALLRALQPLPSAPGDRRIRACRPLLRRRAHGAHRAGGAHGSGRARRGALADAAQGRLRLRAGRRPVGVAARRARPDRARDERGGAQGTGPGGPGAATEGEKR